MAATPQSFGVQRQQPGAQVSRLPFGLSWTTLALAAIVTLAAALRFGNIGAIGEANTYYTAAVKSMLQSWHNFFFVAAEPGGSVSVDKPPVGLWLQAISAYVLGVSGFSVVLPQILAGIASVILLFHLVGRSFGKLAGLIAALALAVTPVAIAVERNNTPDATLIFTLLLAAWAFLRGTETGKLRFLVLGAILVGIGFNIKMMQALLPVPAFYALYLFGSEQRWWKKIIHLGVTTLVIIPIALSWAVAVDLTPADQRPYVGSSTTNSELDLMLGYNGLQRLLGNSFGGNTRTGEADPNSAQSQNTPPASGQDRSGAPGGTPPNGFDAQGGPGGQAGGMFGTGQAGVFRLFQSGLAAQVSWLLPFGLIVLGAMATVVWRREQIVLRRGALLWGGWLLTCAVFFSVAGFFHQYYLAMMGAPLAAVVAIGLIGLWRLRRTHLWQSSLALAIATVATVAFQIYAVNMYGTLGWWVALPIALVVVGLATLVLSMLRRNNHKLPQLAVALIIAGMLFVPAVWSGLTTAYANTSSGLTQAYSGNNRIGMPGALGGDGARRDGNQTGAADDGMPSATNGGMINQALLDYLQANTQDVKYLLVVPSSGAGADYVLATGRPVLYAGGFNGGDDVIDATSLAQLVENGEVRYVLWGSEGSRGGNSKADITSYLQTSCSVVTDASLTTGSSGIDGPGGASTLYQCGT